MICAIIARGITRLLASFRRIRGVIQAFLTWVANNILRPEQHKGCLESCNHPRKSKQNNTLRCLWNTGGLAGTAI